MIPSDWRLELSPDTRREDDGRILIGGAPFRLLRLNAAGARAVDRLVSGAPVGDGAGIQALARRLLDSGMAHPRPTSGRMSPDQVTIVVPFHGPSGELTTTLDRAGPADRIIVVDDASPDESVARTAATRGASVIRHPRNLGPAAARNSGWRRATTELVAFLDAGCLPQDRWLDALLPHFDDPRVMAVAPRITSVIPPSLPRWLAAYETARPSLDRGPAEATVRPRSRVPFVPTAALVVRRAELERVGGFDERLRAGEDVDLVWRLGRDGATVRYEPASTVAHIARPTALAWLRQRYTYGTSAAPLARRHGRAVAPVAVSSWTAGAWMLAGAGAPLAGVAVAATSAALLPRRLEGLRHPWRESARLAGLGHLYGGPAIADAIRRPWWPFAVAAATASRRGRRTVAIAVAAPLLVEWVRERPPLDPVRWVALRLADDLAYGAGVWAGCRRDRSFAALLPDLTNWPGRRPAVETGEGGPSDEPPMVRAPDEAGPLSPPRLRIRARRSPGRTGWPRRRRPGGP